MVRIRMQRLGRKSRPFYRISAIDSRTRRDGRVIEQLGWYDPLAKDEAKQVHLEIDRVKHWLSVGAQPSDTVRDMLVKRDLMDKGPWEADRARRRALVEARKAAAAAPAATESPKTEPAAG